MARALDLKSSWNLFPVGRATSVASGSVPSRSARTPWVGRGSGKPKTVEGQSWEDLRGRKVAAPTRFASAWSSLVAVALRHSAYLCAEVD